MNNTKYYILRMITQFPLEILMIIIKSMNLKSAIRLSETCKLYHRLVFENMHLFVVNELRKYVSDDEIRIYALCGKTDNIFRLRQENLLALYYICAFQFNEPFSKFCQRWIALNEYKITSRFTTIIRQDLLSFSYGRDIDTSINEKEFQLYYKRQRRNGFKNCMILGDLILTDENIMLLVLKERDNTYRNLKDLALYIASTYNTLPAIMLLLGSSPGRNINIISRSVYTVDKDIIFGRVNRLYHEIFTTLD